MRNFLPLLKWIFPSRAVRPMTIIFTGRCTKMFGNRFFFLYVGTLDYQINGYKEITVLSMEFFQNLNSPQLNNCPTSDIRKLF